MKKIIPLALMKNIPSPCFPNGKKKRINIQTQILPSPKLPQLRIVIGPILIQYAGLQEA